jgi:hypothetical protein
LCIFAGIARQRWSDRHLPVAAGPAPNAAVADRAVEARTALS